MKNLFFIISIGLILASCGDDEDSNKPVTEINDGQLIETINNVYYEYYPGKKQVKITGRLNKDEKRHGRWEFYAENGKQLGFTMYENGLRQGHSFNSYPNGAPHYHGEYWADTLIGVWKTYGIDGTVNEKDYGLPEGY